MFPSPVVLARDPRWLLALTPITRRFTSGIQGGAGPTTRTDHSVSSSGSKVEKRLLSPSPAALRLGSKVEQAPPHDHVVV